jgi:hypothetical protein
MALVSLGLLAAYFACGMQVMMANEGWDAADAFYFWCMTVSTVGYGDLAPTTPKTQLFVAGYAVVGIVLVFGVMSDYYGAVQAKLQDLEAKALSLVGIDLVDVHEFPIDTHTPDQVNAKVRYWRRYLLALLPICTLLALFVALHVVRKKSTLAEAIYFGAITATTVGFGDFGFLDEAPRHKCVAALSVMGVVVVFANCVDECLLIRKRQQLRHGDIALPTLEQLEALIVAKKQAKLGDSLNEAEYVVETLLRGDLVDPQILLAIRRSFYWSAHAASDGRRNSSITSQDVAAMWEQKWASDARERPAAPSSD